MTMTICEDNYVFHNSSVILVYNQVKQCHWRHDVSGLHTLCAVNRPPFTLLYSCDTGVYQCVLDESLHLTSEKQVVDHGISFTQLCCSDDMCLLSYSSTQVIATSLQNTTMENTVYQSSQILCAQLSAKSLIVVEVTSKRKLRLVKFNRYSVKGRFIEEAQVILTDFDDSKNSPVLINLSEDGVYMIVLAMHQLWLVISHGSVMSVLAVSKVPLDTVLSVDFDYYLRGIITTPSSIYRTSSFLSFPTPIRCSLVNNSKPTYSLPMQVIQRLFCRPHSILNASSLALCMFHGDYRIIAGILHKLYPALHDEVLRVQEEERWSNDSRDSIQSSMSTLFHWSLQDITTEKEDWTLVNSFCHDLKTLHFNDIEQEEVDSICRVLNIYQTILQIKQTLDIDSHGLQFLLAIQVFHYS